MSRTVAVRHKHEADDLAGTGARPHGDCQHDAPAAMGSDIVSSRIIREIAMERRRQSDRGV
jgi:hypothetical protein